MSYNIALGTPIETVLTDVKNDPIPYPTLAAVLIYYKNKNWLQFLFILKAAVLKQQISKFYPQIQRTEASDHIYFSQRPFINVKAIFCA